MDVDVPSFEEQFSPHRPSPLHYLIEEVIKKAAAEDVNEMYSSMGDVVEDLQSRLRKYDEEQEKNRKYFS